ncbi:hypothetical protein SAMN05216257_10674 [Meinhardsimonia xiamenensis]|jgi:hypothetical protein|uniref:Uncharacterized protein n=1 Tax=Meinhardsimonia xiamenensis TaxID=990712 RepID=A0A1G9G2Y0_9RHOB|nr:hypothetical protein [Meinhardsimonia xiamenensis]PRX32703.1 hypothetical protein LV81_02464 [Meinhardsimonia xiamenensis]SDK94995.1 hypothetical protein SAMN05216257_10674 [Meinhardsimonia xiamenensis]
MMGGMWWSGPGGLVWFLIYAVLVVVPFWRLLPRFGIPNWVALVAIFPLGALILLWVMAFRDELGGRRG